MAIQLHKQFTFTAVTYGIKVSQYWSHSRVRTFILSQFLIGFLFLRMDRSGPLLRLCSLFSTKHQTIFTTNICEKCPSSICCWNSNQQPSGHESPPITTRPGLPPLIEFLYLVFHHFERFLLEQKKRSPQKWPKISKKEVVK